jgi:hypothetical protein
MHIPFTPGVYHSGVAGQAPSVFAGVNAVDGDDYSFSKLWPGTLYWLIDKTNRLVQVFVKREMQALDQAWGNLGGVGVIQETVLYSAFTDGGGASGTYTMKQTIPVGAVVLRSQIEGVTGFTGNVSATLTIGDGTDADRYNTGTPSIFTTDTSVDAGAVSGTAWHDAAKTPVLTVAASTDFTLITAGRVTVKIFYLY